MASPGPAFPTEVIDEHGHVYTLHPDPLGAGGQGVVFRTQDPNMAVKLLGDWLASPITERATSQTLLSRLSGATEFRLHGEDRERLRRRLEKVRTLPLPDVKIARPLAMLRDHAGYTMQLLGGMVPMRHLVAGPQTPSLARFYLETGGLRRRLHLLARAADMLARLHAVPLAYADVSFNNLFVPEDTTDHHVWLIDADNLEFSSAQGTGLYTPGFGAPEVVAGRSGATSLADAHAFAVLAFWVLAQVHPFIGDLVEAGDWSQDEDLEAKAFAGELPWIHDPEDDRNYTETGIFPRELVLTPKLKMLFMRAFGEGLHQPTKRPGMREWAEALRQAADFTLGCPGCGSTFFVTARACPWCQAPEGPRFLYACVRRWDPGIDEDGLAVGDLTRILWHRVMDAGVTHLLERSLFVPSVPGSEDPAWLQVEILRNGVRLSPLQPGNWSLARIETGQVEPLDGPKILAFPVVGKGWHLHAGSLDAPHRVLSFHYY